MYRVKVTTATPALLQGAGCWQPAALLQAENQKTSFLKILTVIGGNI